MTSPHDPTTADHDALCEQLSAWLDGELPEAEARFLQRRLEHDAALRAKLARLQTASSCLRNQPWRPMDAGLADRVAQALAAPGVRAPARFGRWHWAAAASVAALAILLAPRLGLQSDVVPAAPLAARAAPAPATAPSPAVADLVVPRTSVASTAPAADATRVATATGAAGARATVADVPAAAPGLSPADFPLVDTGARRWPRSELAVAGNDPALEAYLVRHNQMLANEGLGGFVPYVDVVASGASAQAAPPASPPADAAPAPAAGTRAP